MKESQVMEVQEMLKFSANEYAEHLVSVYGNRVLPKNILNSLLPYEFEEYKKVLYRVQSNGE